MIIDLDREFEREMQTQLGLTSDLIFGSNSSGHLDVPEILSHPSPSDGTVTGSQFGE